MLQAGFSKQAQDTFQATQKLWHMSGVERHAEGAPGLNGPSSDALWNPDIAFIDSAIHTLQTIRNRLVTNEDLTDREFRTLHELKMSSKNGYDYIFNPKTCELLLSKGFATQVSTTGKKKYRITPEGLARLERK